MLRFQLAIRGNNFSHRTTFSMYSTLMLLISPMVYRMYICTYIYLHVVIWKMFLHKATGKGANTQRELFGI